MEANENEVILILCTLVSCGVFKNEWQYFNLLTLEVSAIGNIPWYFVR
jgi:hypothetical protein